MSGISGLFKRALLAKRNLDQDRSTPGAHNPVGGHLMALASTADALSSLATHNVQLFHAAVSEVRAGLIASVKELLGM